jgi:hypothetical protein
MKRLLAILIGFAIVSLGTGPTAAQTSCTDGPEGPAQLCYDNHRLDCYQAAPGPVLVTPTGATKTLDSCATKTLATTDIGTTAPTPSTIPINGTGTDTATGTGTNVLLNNFVNHAKQDLLRPSGVCASGEALTSTVTGQTSCVTVGAFPASSAGWLHDNGSGTRAWTTPTTSDVGAANQSLSNLTNPTSLNQHVYPGSDAAYDIGYWPSARWRNIVASGYVQADGNLVAGGNIVSNSGFVNATNISQYGHALLDLQQPSSVCTGGQVLTTTTTGQTQCVTNGSGTGIACSGSCSTSSMAKFASATAVTDATAGTDYLAPSAMSGTTGYIARFTGTNSVGNAAQYSLTPSALNIPVADGSGKLNAWVDSSITNMLTYSDSGTTINPSGSWQDIISQSVTIDGTMMDIDAEVTYSSSYGPNTQCEMRILVAGSQYGIIGWTAMPFAGAVMTASAHGHVYGLTSGVAYAVKVQGVSLVNSCSASPTALHIRTFK